MSHDSVGERRDIQVTDRATSGQRPLRNRHLNSELPARQGRDRACQPAFRLPAGLVPAALE